MNLCKNNLNYLFYLNFLSMKKLRKIGSILFMSIAIAAIFSSCKKEPIASFTYSPENPVRYDVVTFTNTSSDADTYLWEIGASSSTETSPAVILTDVGDYIVKLTATGEGGSQTIEKTVTVAEANNYATVTGNISYIDDDGDHVDDFVYDGSEMKIDTAYWQGSTIRMLATDSKFENPLLIKFTPNHGVSGLDQVYTYSAGAAAAGTYDFGMTGSYAGFNFAWTVDAYGISTDPGIATPYVDATVALVFEPTSGEKIYDIVIEDILINAGDYALDWSSFLGSTNPSKVTVHWRGPITPEAATKANQHFE